MAPALICLIGAVLMALFLLDYEMGMQDMARRFWPRRVPAWTRLPLAALLLAPLVGWLVFVLAQELDYAAMFFVLILVPTEIVYVVSRRWYAKRQIRRQRASAPTTRAAH